MVSVCPWWPPAGRNDQSTDTMVGLHVHATSFLPQGSLTFGVTVVKGIRMGALSQTIEGLTRLLALRTESRESAHRYTRQTFDAPFQCSVQVLKFPVQLVGFVQSCAPLTENTFSVAGLLVIFTIPPGQRFLRTVWKNFRGVRMY